MKPRIIILGAGIIGLASACSLARRGASVTVLDIAPIGRESSWAGAGILSALLPWDYPPSVNQLIEEGRRSWPSWVSDIRHHSSVDPEHRVTGMLVAGVKDMKPAIEWCQAHDWPYQQGEDLLEDRVSHIPGTSDTLKKDPHACLWLPEVGQIRNPRLMRGMVDLALSLGVEIRDSQTEIALQHQGITISRVSTEQGEHLCSHVVICAGAWSSRVLDGFEHPTPIKPIRGQMLLFKAAPGRLSCILFKDGKYLVPRADGHILAGSTLEDSGYDKSTTLSAALELKEFAYSLLPELAKAGPVAHWAGLRPGSPGNLPVIARHPIIENLYMNSGHFRYGVTMAPASAERLSRLLMNDPSAQNDMSSPADYSWPLP